MTAESRIVAHSPGFWPRRPLIMGIVNVTPDSFSDGGELNRWELAVAHALRLGREGADLLDIGGESTRPGAKPVGVQEQLVRILPVVKVLAGETKVPLCVDTRRAEVADATLKAGAHWVNDVSALGEPEMAKVVARHGAGIILMHMQGEPGTMQVNPRYGDVVEEVCEFLAERAEIARAAGLDRSRIWLDPGIGFGKTLQHNLQLFRALDRIAALGYPMVLGASRKGFIDQLSAAPPEERLAGSLAAAGLCLRIRRSIVRVHDVAATRQYLLVRRALETGAPLPWEPSGLDIREELRLPRSRDDH
jgi:dihydropteroate synthase